MEELRKKAGALLAAGTVKVVIGYAGGSDAVRVRAIFARQPEQAEQLIFNEHCRQNLAVYLLKPEVMALGKAAVVARPATLRALLQFAVENQLVDGAVVALAVNDSQPVAELTSFGAIEEYVAGQPRGLSQGEKDELAHLDGLSREERWAFWTGELSRCIKCYACRAACPMCYCARCVVDVNQPQWRRARWATWNGTWCGRCTWRAAA
jgi:hypothetical protein